MIEIQWEYSIFCYHQGLSRTANYHHFQCRLYHHRLLAGDVYILFPVGNFHFSVPLGFIAYKLLSSLPM